MFMKMLKVFAVLIAFILILLVVSHYVDIGDFFNKDNAISKTGAAVVETVKDNLDGRAIIKEADLNDMLDTSIENLRKGGLKR